MPQVQIVDTTERAPEPTGIEQFFSRLGKSYKDRSDRDEIGEILKEYSQNQLDAKAYGQARQRLETSSISPSKRLEATNALNDIEKSILEKDKVMNAKVKVMQDQAKASKDRERAQESVYEMYKPFLGEEEARRLSSIDTEATAQKKVSQLNKKNADSSGKKEDKEVPFKQGLNILKRQREILNTGHLGPKIGGIGKTGRKVGSTFSKEGNALRSEYERLGKSLISLSSNIPIRNRQEFEVLAHDLYDPNKSQEEIQGILNAMERILNGHLESKEEPSVSQQNTHSFREGQTATGPQGQKIVFKGGTWQPL